MYIYRVPVDPTRIAANVIAGIGFLGAGTIIRYGSSVKGLTTAASIWTVAAVGLAVGCGYYIGAFFTTAIMLMALLFFRKIENIAVQKKN
jgi:putative Mg2+ transporter-C (MgtC) family protein